MIVSYAYKCQHRQKCISSCSFDLLLCPEPHCNFMAGHPEEVRSHMSLIHMSTSKAKRETSQKLFFCPECVLEYGPNDRRDSSSVARNRNR